MSTALHNVMRIVYALSLIVMIIAAVRYIRLHRSETDKRRELALYLGSNLCPLLLLAPTVLSVPRGLKAVLGVLGMVLALIWFLILGRYQILRIVEIRRRKAQLAQRGRDMLAEALAMERQSRGE
ncbi:MAG TPA: hypothetical protein VNW46_13215 [Gemmatimonadaceae bacterium]|jgi:hypothetical protein|nr:hypothetical protein [Gemmatimonadaceae bacterium]